MSGFVNFINQSILQKASDTGSLSFQFQQSIKKGNIESTKKFINQGVLLTQPLPNGELPLHFAIREGQQEIVAMLLKLGADPEIKDNQNLSAIDHAILNRDDKMTAIVLGHKFGKSFEEIHEQIQSKAWQDHIVRLQREIQKLSKVDVAKLSPIGIAAYEGNIEVLNSISVEEADQLDEKGLAAIHYAILGKQEAALELFIQKGCNIHHLTANRESLLHFAAVAGSKRNIETLISSGIDVNQKNSDGETAMHFAAAKESLVIIEALIQGKAELYLKDNRGISALALVGLSAYERDPLAVSGIQLSMCALSCLFWVTHFTSTSNLIPRETIAFIFFSYTMFMTITESFHLFQHIKNQAIELTLGSIVGYFAMLTSIFTKNDPTFHTLNLGLQIFRTGNVAYTAFNSLKACWRNAGYRTKDVLKNIVVNSINTFDSIDRLRYMATALIENNKRIADVNKTLSDCFSKVSNLNATTDKDKISKRVFEEFYSYSYTSERVIEQRTSTGHRGLDAHNEIKGWNTPDKVDEIVSFSTFNKEDMIKCDQTFPFSKKDYDFSFKSMELLEEIEKMSNL